MAPYSAARSQNAPIGAMSPSIEYTDSKATTFGRSGSAARSFRPRSSGSLWRKMHFSAMACRTPAIIEAWLASSENRMHPGRWRPMVDSAASFAT